MLEIDPIKRISLKDAIDLIQKLKSSGPPGQIPIDPFNFRLIYIEYIK